MVTALKRIRLCLLNSVSAADWLRRLLRIKARAMSHRIDQVTIRAANAAHLPERFPLLNNAFVIETFLDGTRTDEKRLSATMGAGDVLLAERNGRPVGCV
jgi:hypothetical protein